MSSPNQYHRRPIKACFNFCSILCINFKHKLRQTFFTVLNQIDTWFLCVFGEGFSVGRIAVALQLCVLLTNCTSAEQCGVIYIDNSPVFMWPSGVYIQKTPI